VKGDLVRASFHYQRSIASKQATGNVYGAAETRANLARVLGLAGRASDARDYALAALSGFQTFGDRAKKEVMETLGGLPPAETVGVAFSRCFSSR
jgi:hypothetical protein